MVPGDRDYSRILLLFCVVIILARADDDEVADNLKYQ